MAKFDTIDCDGFKIVSEVVPYATITGTEWRAEVKTRGLGEDKNIVLVCLGQRAFSSAHDDADAVSSVLPAVVEAGTFDGLPDTVVVSGNTFIRTGVTSIGWNVYELT